MPENQEIEKPNFYGIIPAHVRYDKRLSSSEKVLYSELTALTHSEGYCWATNAYFAKLYNKNVMTVSIWITNLEKYGYVKVRQEVESIDGEKFRTRRYIWIIEKSIGGAIEKSIGGAIEKSIANNTSINNTRYNKENIYMGENEKSIVNRNKKTNTSITEQPAADSNKSKIDNSRYFPIAEQLAAVLKEKQNITTPPSHIIKWTNNIRLACEERKINPAKLKRDLQIYADNFNAEYRPIIECGGSLRKKIVSLWGFIDRCQNPKQSKPTYSKQKNFPLEDHSRFEGRKIKEVSNE